MADAVVVTGASRGIGAATARLLAASGYAVCVNYRSDAAADAVVDSIRASGGRAVAVQADVSTDAEVKRLFEASDRQLGPLAGLVNNAGILEQQSTVARITEERLLRVLRANVVSAFLCAREAVLRMSRQHGGRGGAIVNVGSAASRLGAANEYVDYAASKGGMDSLALGLAREMATDGVRVNAVRPGVIETDIHASTGVPDRAARLAPLIPVGRAGTADEVAHAIIWLLSDAASYTTGALLDVSGGR